jgi:hypothetical protein
MDVDGVTIKAGATATTVVRELSDVLVPGVYDVAGYDAEDQIVTEQARFTVAE